MKINTPPREDEFDEIDEDSILEVIDLEDLIDEGEDENGDDDELEDMDEMDDEMLVEEGVEDMSRVTFRKHTGSVFSCCCSREGFHVASGGEDDLAYVWDMTTGNVILECGGHKDSVTQVCFSHDSRFLATGDMAGHIQVWEIGALAKIWEFDTSDLNWLRWHPSSNVLLAGCDDGELWMWKLPQGNTKPLPNYGVSAETAELMPDGKRLVVGYRNGFIRIIDLKTGSLIDCISDSLAHTQGITCISTHKDNSLILTGSLDGSAKITNTNTGKVIATFNCGAKGGAQREDEDGDQQCSENSVEVVSFCPTVPNIAITATICGTITIWDISTQTSRTSIVQGSGMSSLSWLPPTSDHHSIFYATCLDGVLRSYNALSGELVHHFTGHTNRILDGCIKNVDQGVYFITSSDDNTLRVFDLNIPM